MFRARIHIVPQCVSENQERGVFGLRLCELVSFKTHKHTGSIVVGLCASGAPFEGVGHCGGPKQNVGWLF